MKSRRDEEFRYRDNAGVPISDDGCEKENNDFERLSIIVSDSFNIVAVTRVCVFLIWIPRKALDKSFTWAILPKSNIFVFLVFHYLLRLWKSIRVSSSWSQRLKKMQRRSWSNIPYVDNRTNFVMFITKHLNIVMFMSRDECLWQLGRFYKSLHVSRKAFVTKFSCKAHTALVKTLHKYAAMSFWQ